MQRSIASLRGRMKKGYEKDINEEFKEVAKTIPKLFQPFLFKILEFVKKIVRQMRETDREIRERRKKVDLVQSLKTVALKEFQKKEEIDLKYSAKNKFNKTPSKLRLNERRKLILETLEIRIGFCERQIEELEKWIEGFLTPQTRSIYLKLLWASSRLEAFRTAGNSTTVVNPVDWDNRESTSTFWCWQERQSQQIYEILKNRIGQFVIFYGGSLVRSQSRSDLALLEDVTRGKVENSEDEWYLKGKFYWLEYNCYLDRDIPKLNIREPYFGSYRFAVFESEFYNTWLDCNSIKV